MLPSRDQIYSILESVKDPEVPVLSVVELGVVRDAIVTADSVTIKITPTYSGCPALHVMESDILSALKDAGIKNAKVETIYAPAWTTDWISDAARAKLKNYGIAPPQTRGEGLVLISPSKVIPCPFCNSANTTRKSEFGSTACKALLYCNSCHQPFEHFKDF